MVKKTRVEHLVNIFVPCYNATCLQCCRLIDDRVWPSGKAVDFGSTILGSNPSTRAYYLKTHNKCRYSCTDVCFTVVCEYTKKEKGSSILQ